MTCSHNPTTRETEVRGSRVQSQPRLHKTLSQKGSEKPQTKTQLYVTQCVQKAGELGRALPLCFTKGGRLCDMLDYALCVEPWL